MRNGARVRLRFAADDRLVFLVRRGDATAFEVIYDRHARELLSFCRHMLGSRQDAEDALQSTFASAYRVLVADEREIDLRPWLFAIARNACLSILRQRRPTAEVIGAVALRTDPAAQVEQREDLRQALASLLELPEHQRVALVLAELHGLSHREIGAVLEVRAEQVKSYVYQARSSLTSEREARGADCLEIREELAIARGAALLKGHLRRHLRSCPGCRAYAENVSRQRRALGLLLPVAPSLALKRRALEAAFGRAPDTGVSVAATTAGASTAAPTAELVGAGANALLVKLIAGMAFLAAAGTSVGTGVLNRPATQRPQAAHTSGPRTLTRLHLSASVGPAGAAAPRPGGASWAPPPRVGAPGGRVPAVGGQVPAAPVDQQRSHTSPHLGGGESSAAASQSGGAREASEEALGRGRGKEPHGSGGGKSEGPRGSSEEAPGQVKREEPHGGGGGKAEGPRGRSEEAPGQVKSEEPRGSGGGKAEGPRGRSEEAPGQVKSEEPRGSGGGKSEGLHGDSEEAPGQVRSEEPNGSGGGKAEGPHGESHQ